MLRAEKPDREVNQRHVYGAEYSQHRRKYGRLAARRKSSQHEITDINQPQQKREREPQIPCPPDTPNRPRPDRPSDENDGAKYHADLSAYLREDIGFYVLANEIEQRSNKVNDEQKKSRPRGWHMVIEDALHVAHRPLGRSNHKSGVKPKTQQQGGDDCQDRKSAFHSASRTVSNNSKHAVVNTTSYATSNAIQKRAESSPVSTAVVAFTIPSSAGIESGNSSRGSMISRARVRIEIAAKKVPLTTSAHVPSAAIGISSHPGPSARNL